VILSYRFARLGQWTSNGTHSVLVISFLVFVHTLYMSAVLTRWVYQEVGVLNILCAMVLYIYVHCCIDVQ
jgi:hypothetical protein